MSKIITMKIGIIGAGASGLYSAMLVKRKHPDWSVIIFDKEKKAGRKLLATGNGHCNLLNASLSSDSFNHKEIAQKYIHDYPLPYLLDSLHSFGVMTMEVGEGIYPLTYSASSFCELLLEILKQENVELRLEEEVQEYETQEAGIVVKTNRAEFIVNYLFVCVGGKSSPSLGSNGSFFPVLKNHGYHILPLRPGLAPMVVKEKKYLKPLAGLRHECSICLYKNERFIARQDGEVLFKNDGLSGICVFNLVSEILRDLSKADYKLVIDLFPNRNLVSPLERSFDLLGDGFLAPFLQKPLQKEAFRQYGRETIRRADMPSFEKTLHRFVYHFEAAYPFTNSQMTIGGVSFDDVLPSFMSKKEKNVFLLGEVLDMDGLCGGNNLAWALMSALKVVDSL